MAFAISKRSLLTDTISPPPNDPGTITGLQQVCEGLSSTYIADIPIGCNTSWYLDGVLQPSINDSLEILWITSGTFVISLELTCDTSSLPPSYLEVEVEALPNSPAAVTGEDDVCVQSTGYYSTEVMEGESCQWKVDGIVQPSDSAQLSYYWGLPGEYSIEVRAINDCGLSEGVFMAVSVNEWPEVNLGNDTTLVEGQSLLLDAGNPGCHYLWSTGDTTQTIAVTSSGTYQVTVSNACGEVTDEINVEVLVGISDIELLHPIFTEIHGNQLSILGNTKEIKQVQVIDLQGIMWLSSSKKPHYELPGKGLFLVVVILSNGQVIRMKVVNL
jgi:hypothetical protein